jgi:hypothetical protein
VTDQHKPLPLAHLAESMGVEKAWLVSRVLARGIQPVRDKAPKVPTSIDLYDPTHFQEVWEDHCLEQAQVFLLRVSREIRLGALPDPSLLVTEPRAKGLTVFFKVTSGLREVRVRWEVQQPLQLLTATHVEETFLGYTGQLPDMWKLTDGDVTGPALPAREILAWFKRHPPPPSIWWKRLIEA